MSITGWEVGTSGNWSQTGYWSGGLPNSSLDAYINAFGTYTVSLTANANANSLTINSPNATLNQRGGYLNIDTIFLVNQGTAILRSANDITNGVTQNGGLLEIGNNGALGTAEYTFNGGELRALSDVMLTNQIAMAGNITIAAAHGMTLTEDASSWSYDASSGGNVVFGQGTDDGSILWLTGSASVTLSGNYSVEIAKGTFVGGDTSWSFLASLSNKTQIDSAGTLDMNGYTGTVENLQGSGSIVNNSGAADLSVAGGGNFSGTIGGATLLEVAPGALTLTGANTYTGGTIIDNSSTLQIGNGGTTGSIKGAIIDNGALIYDRANTLNVSNTISGTGTVTYEGGGNVAISLSNIYSGNTTVIGETVSTSLADAFGTGTLELNNAHLVVTGSRVMSYGRIWMDPGSSFAAADGKTVSNVTPGGSWVIDGNANASTFTFGDSVNDGVIVWNTGAGSTVVNIEKDFFDIKGGTLRAGDASFGFLTGNCGGLAVEAGATLDFATFSGTIDNLSGAGTVMGHGGAAVAIGGGDFDGVITGGLSLVIYNGVVLTGTNTYTQGTTIDGESTLMLGNGGTTGSVVGDITDNGKLIINRSDAINETAAISGSGGLVQAGSGTLTINRAETYTGETDVVGGTLAVGTASSIGTGTLGIQGGEFLALGNVTLTNALTLGGAGTNTIAAATGKTLTFASSGWIEDATASNHLVFGDGTNNGTVVWNTLAGSTVINVYNFDINVMSGTLKAGGSSMSFLVSHASQTTISSAATLDIAGFGVDVVKLTGAGHIINSGAETSFAIEGGNFSGTIGNGVDIDVFGNTTFNGVAYSGVVNVETNTVLTLKGSGTLPQVALVTHSTLDVSNGQGVDSVVTVAAGGGDQINGGLGNDTFRVGSTLSLIDSISGGSGTDTVVLAGDYSGGLTFSPTTLISIEDLRLANGFSYNLTTNDATVAGTKTLIVDASALTATHSLTFNGSAETNGHFQITGGLGADVLTGGARSDTFVYTSAAQSSSVHHDTINAFDFGSDKFDITGTISAIDAKVNRTVSSASFDTDISAAASSGHLLAHTAMLVTANAGTLSGHTFLVVDLNGTAGYQAGADLVIDIHGATGTLATSDFI